MIEINVDQITSKRHDKPDVSFNCHITGVNLPGHQANFQITLDKSFPPLHLANIFDLVAKTLIKSVAPELHRGNSETNGNDPLDLPAKGVYDQSMFEKEHVIHAAKCSIEEKDDVFVGTLVLEDGNYDIYVSARKGSSNTNLLLDSFQMVALYNHGLDEKHHMKLGDNVMVRR